MLLQRVDDADDEVDQVARCAELPGVALAAEHREQVFKGVAQFLGMVVAEGVDFLQESCAAFPGRDKAGRRS